jgi:hypothetical protein
MKAHSSHVRGALAALVAAGMLAVPALAQSRQAQPTRSPARDPGQSSRSDLARRIDEQRVEAARRNVQQAESQRAQQAREQQQSREQQAQQEQQRAQNARQNEQEAKRAENARQQQQQQQQRAENARQKETAGAQQPRAEQARSNAQSNALAKQVYARVGQHRSRLARLDRLNQLFTEKNDARKLAQLDQMRQRELAAFEQEMTRMREQLGPDMYARVRAALDNPAGPSRAREAGTPAEGRTPRQRGETPPPAENPTPRGGGL